MQLLVVSTYYFTNSFGSLIYLFGFSTSIINIILLIPYRNNPCTFLLIYSSAVDCIVLNVGLLPRILAVGFSMDPTLTNLAFCKIRTYLLRISTLISLYTICLMSIDRFFISCRTVRWRQKSSISCTRWVAFISTFLIAMEGLPFFILTDIHRTNDSISCTPMMNLAFSQYAYFFCIPVLFGILPLTILITTGVLIYYKLHNRTHLRRAQRSLTLTILLRIALVVVSCGPYTSYFVYTAITLLTVGNKSPQRLAVENFALSILSIFLYITYSSSFIVHYLISTTYRKELMNLLQCHRGRRGNTVQPVQVALANSTQTYGQKCLS